MTQPELEPQVEVLLESIDIDAPLVGIVMGSESDSEVMRAASDELADRGISYEVSVLSAHRNPDGVREYSLSAEARGIKVIIAGAGKAAALPGVIAAYTELPVIGVPIRTSDLGGLDSLLSIVQMPSGVPGGLRGHQRGPQCRHPGREDAASVLADLRALGARHRAGRVTAFAPGRARRRR